jgi:diacylglycerol kinase family enzyme
VKRLAAAVALSSLGGLLVLGLVFLADTANLLIALGFVFTSVFFLWIFLTRRSSLRYFGLPLVLIAILGLAAYAFDHKVALVLWISSLWVFGTTARAALAGAGPTGQPGAVEPVPAALHGVLFINPRSGGGKALRANLAAQAQRRRIDTVVLQPGDDLLDLAECAVRNGADVIGMAGGDGSQALVASVAMKHDVAHVCVPAGTRNHFALDLGLDRRDLVGALDAFTDALERRIDLARVNDRVFVNNASLGLYAGVVQSTTYREAKLGTWRRMLPDLIGPHGSTIDLRFRGPNDREYPGAALVVVSNNPYDLRGLVSVGTRPHLDTGRLGILTARLRGARTVARIATFGALGQQTRVGALRQWSSTEFEVSSAGPVAVGIDGEAAELTPPLRFVSLPAALRVRVPQSAGRRNGLAPVRVSAPTIVRLARLAAGMPAEARRAR